MKRTYPLILIDRSKSGYENDYIVCTDKTVGFIAKVTHFKTETSYNEFVEAKENSINEEWFIVFKLKNGGLILNVEEFLYQFDNTPENISRIKTLLKKSMKKYLHAEVDRTPHSDFSIENQIKLQKLTIERAKSNYNDLVLRSSKPEADFNIALSEKILETLQNYRDNLHYFTLSKN